MGKQRVSHEKHVTHPVPYQFRDAQEIIDRLSESRDEIAKQFEKREASLEQIARVSVGGNTFRAFRGRPSVRPSVVFRDWAAKVLADKNTIGGLIDLESQTAYDEWLREFSCAFRRMWQERTGTLIPYGPSRKLPDLLLKHSVWWTGLHDAHRTRLMDFLHVPLDSFTLVGIRNCITDPEIPPTARMNFVVGTTMYNQIQAAIRAVTDQAHVPAIYFDVLAWNMRH